ncbi:GGDEF domain-containing protein [Phormidium yuhuli AB48]|uniref:GGDEF domain-containing protein n=1 Tax=Phormidium yuhuli AB48 TaxID=2940671 RepID=A0ABY5AKG5_9CYAN|nr:GGDEF domain-containing protein [Phormidium yuhuli]USR89347.1 GGDEF domain-containing protein [Phormidium yuhuli AB48]
MMTSVSSLLQSIVLVSLWYSANQYKGISIYVLGNIFSCLSFVGFLLRNIFSLPLEVRLVNNLIFVSAILLHSIGIGQFLSRKINYRAWLWCFLLFLFSQVYLVYYFDDYFWRNFSILITIALAYGIGCKYILDTKIINYRVTSLSLAFILAATPLIVIMRLILLLDGQTHSIFTQTFANSFTFLSMFIIDFLRNGFFVLMVSQRMYSELHEVAEMDFLTQVFNRGATARRINKYLGGKTQTDVTLILLDIDYFKKINDTYGHDAGDQVLRDVARVLESALTFPELLGRWGGEEFIIFLPNCSAREARDRAELFRYNVETQNVYYVLQPLSCTLSLGVVTAPRHQVDLDELLKRADIALYQAKRNGRNRAEFVIIP